MQREDESLYEAFGKLIENKNKEEKPVKRFFEELEKEKENHDK